MTTAAKSFDIHHARSQATEASRDEQLQLAQRSEESSRPVDINCTNEKLEKSFREIAEGLFLSKKIASPLFDTSSCFDAFLLSEQPA